MSLEPPDGAKYASPTDNIHRPNDISVRALGAKNYPYLSHKTLTGTLFSFSLRVIRNRGYMAVTRK